MSNPAPNPMHYLAAPIITELRKQQRWVLNTPEDVTRYLKQNYKIDISKKTADSVLHFLGNLGIVQKMDDHYAGTLYKMPIPSSNVLNGANIKQKDDALSTILSRGPDLWRRAFENEQFWNDLDAVTVDDLASGPLDSSEPEAEIPAADRVVTVTHNQYTAIDTPLSELEDALEKDNGVPEEPTLRERILGQLRAGRELLRSGYVELGALNLTLIVGLNLLIEKYKDHVIGAMASALLTLVLHELGVSGF